MKTSTKYAGMAALGAIIGLKGATSMLNRAIDIDHITEKIQATENKKNDLVSKLIDCVEINTDFCNGISSEYKIVSSEALELRQQRKDSPSPAFPLMLSFAGFYVGLFGFKRYLKEKRNEYKAEFEAKQSGDQ